MSVRPLITNEAVVRDTPARRATSSRVTRGGAMEALRKLSESSDPASTGAVGGFTDRQWALVRYPGPGLHGSNNSVTPLTPYSLGRSLQANPIQHKRARTRRSLPIRPPVPPRQGDT